MGSLYRHTLCGFRAGEVAKITGLSEDAQRAWRSWGFLPKNRERKHSRLDVRDLCEILLLRALVTACRVPRDEATRWIPSASGVLVRHALSAEGAIAGPVSKHPCRTTTEIAAYIAGAYSGHLKTFDLIVWRDATVSAVGDGPAALATAVAAGVGGPTTVFALKNLGRDIARQAGRPLLVVERVETDDPLAAHEEATEGATLQ